MPFIFFQSTLNPLKKDRALLTQGMTVRNEQGVPSDGHSELGAPPGGKDFSPVAAAILATIIQETGEVPVQSITGIVEPFVVPPTSKKVYTAAKLALTELLDAGVIGTKMRAGRRTYFLASDTDNPTGSSQPSTGSTPKYTRKPSTRSAQPKSPPKQESTRGEVSVPPKPAPKALVQALKAGFLVRQDQVVTRDDIREWFPGNRGIRLQPRMLSAALDTLTQGNNALDGFVAVETGSLSYYMLASEQTAQTRSAREVAEKKMFLRQIRETLVSSEEGIWFPQLVERMASLFNRPVSPQEVLRAVDFLQQIDTRHNPNGLKIVARKTYNPRRNKEVLFLTVVEPKSPTPSTSSISEE